MRTVPPQADPFPHPHKVRHSHAEVYRRGYSMSLGQKTHGTAHQVRGGSHGYVRNEGVARCWIVVSSAGRQSLTQHVLSRPLLDGVAKYSKRASGLVAQAVLEK
jgi:hypothetical protein